MAMTRTLGPICARLIRLEAVCAAVLFLVALSPIEAVGQQPPAGQTPSQSTPAVKTKAFGKWNIYCRDQKCALAQHTQRAIMVFGFNASDGALVMQVRVPPDAPVNRPLAIRLHKSGALLHLRVTKCSNQLCVASAIPKKTQQVIDLFSKENSGTLAYQLAQTMMIEDFTLKNFNKAIAELQKNRPPKANTTAKKPRGAAKQ